MSRSVATLRWKGLVYRAHNLHWAYAPTSGEGAKRHGGRFNRRGMAALYTSLDVKTAWMEAQQGFPFKPQPMTMVAYEADCAGIVDLTDNSVMGTLSITAADLACPWEALANKGEVPASWHLADRLLADGNAGVLVRSFAPGCGAENINLVFWEWSDDPPHQARAIDDQNRLSSRPVV